MAENKKDEGIELNVPSRAQRDLEQRHGAGYRPVVVDNTVDETANPEVTNKQFAVEDNDTSGYRGVSEEYMTYASEADKPLVATEGIEKEVLDYLDSGVPGVFKSAPPNDEIVREVGGQSVEHINTATSGEAHSSKLIDRPVPVGATRVVPDGEASASAPAPAPASAPASATSVPTPTKSTPAKKTS